MRRNYIFQCCDFRLLAAWVLVGISCLCPPPAAADLSGIRAYFAENDIDWNFASGKREASVNELSFQLEEAIDTGTRLGAGFGYMDVLLRGDATTPSRSFNAHYLEFFARHPFTLSENIELSTRFNYRFNSGDDRNEDDPARIDWSEAGLELGLGIQVSRVRLTPYAVYLYLDGDIDAASGSESFDLDDQISTGLRLDLFIDDTSYVGFSVETGDYSRVFLVFAREY